MALTKISTGMLKQDAASSDLNIDAGTLFLDVSNNRVGIANTSPSQALDVTGNAVVSGSVTATGLTTSGNFLKTGTNGNYTISANGNDFYYGRNGTNYHIANTANGGFQFLTGSSSAEALRITSAQNVNIANGKLGIGFTTAPSAKLQAQVNNTATPAQIATDSNAVLLLENTNASGSAGIRLRGGNGAGVLMYGENNSTDKFYLTPRNDSGKSFTLDHVGNGVFQGSVTSTGLTVSETSSGNLMQVASFVNPVGTANTGVRLWLSGTNTTTRGTFIDAVAESTSNNHTLRFGTSAGASTPIERMRLDSSGRLLINATTTAFSDKLYVNGDAYVTGGWRIGTGATYIGKIYNSSGIMSIETDSNRDIQFGDSGTPAIMYIDTSTENVGIGTSSPDSKLTIYNAATGITGLVKLWTNTSNNTAADGGAIEWVGSGDKTAIGSKIAATRVEGGGKMDLRFYTGRNSDSDHEKMRILVNGNVGIGTTAPGTPLDVQSSSSAEGIRVRGRSSDQIGQITFTESGGTARNQLQSSSSFFNIKALAAIPMIFYTNGTERMRFSSSSPFLFLGHTGHTWGTFNAVAQIGRTGFIANYDGSNSNQQTVIGNNTYYGASGYTSIEASTGSAYMNLSSGNARFFTAPATTAGSAQTFTERLTLTNGGNVGIGTDTPGAKLHVKHGDIRLEGNGESGQDITFTITNDNSGNEVEAGLIRFIDTGGGQSNRGAAIASYMPTADTGDLRFYTSAGADRVERMRIYRNGNVGIGTNNPGHLLDILKTGSGDATVNIKSTTGGDPTVIFNSAAANRSGLIKYQDNGTNVGRIEYVHNGDRIDFQAGSATGATMSIENGKVGIGTSVPQGILHVAQSRTSGGDLWTAIGAGNAAALHIQNTGNAANTNAVLYFRNSSAEKASIGARFVNQSTGETELRFGTTNSSGASYERMRLDGDGKLGIGFTDPSGSLHVTAKDNGGADVFIVAQNTTNNRISGYKILDEGGNIQGLWRYDNGGNYASLSVGTAAAPTTITLGESSTGISFTSVATSFNSGKVATIRGEVTGTGHGNLAFDTFQGGSGGGERMVILADGRVGIGQTSFGVNGKLQVTGGIGLTGTSVIRNSTNADDGSTLKFLGNQFVAGQNNSHSYSYSGGGLIASVSPSAGAILLDVGANSTSGHRLKVTNGSDGVSGSLSYSGNATFSGLTTLSGNLTMMSNTVYASQVYVHDRLGHLNDADTYIDFGVNSITLSASSVTTGANTTIGGHLQANDGFEVNVPQGDKGFTVATSSSTSNQADYQVIVCQNILATSGTWYDVAYVTHSPTIDVLGRIVANDATSHGGAGVVYHVVGMYGSVTAHQKTYQLYNNISTFTNFEYRYLNSGASSGSYRLQVKGTWTNASHNAYVYTTIRGMADGTMYEDD